MLIKKRWNPIKLEDRIVHGGGNDGIGRDEECKMQKFPSQISGEASQDIVNLKQQLQQPLFSLQQRLKKLDQNHETTQECQKFIGLLNASLERDLKNQGQLPENKIRQDLEINKVTYKKNVSMEQQYKECLKQIEESRNDLEHEVNEVEKSIMILEDDQRPLSDRLIELNGHFINKFEILIEKEQRFCSSQSFEQQKSVCQLQNFVYTLLKGVKKEEKIPKQLCAKLQSYRQEEEKLHQEVCRDVTAFEMQLTQLLSNVQKALQELALEEQPIQECIEYAEGHWKNSLKKMKALDFDKDGLQYNKRVYTTQVSMEYEYNQRLCKIREIKNVLQQELNETENSLVMLEDHRYRLSDRLIELNEHFMGKLSSLVNEGQRLHQSQIDLAETIRKYQDVVQKQYDSKNEKKSRLSVFGFKNPWSDRKKQVQVKPNENEARDKKNLHSFQQQQETLESNREKVLERKRDAYQLCRSLFHLLKKEKQREELERHCKKFPLDNNGLLKSNFPPAGNDQNVFRPKLRINRSLKDKDVNSDETILFFNATSTWTKVNIRVLNNPPLRVLFGQIDAVEPQEIKQFEKNDWIVKNQQYQFQKSIFGHAQMAKEGAVPTMPKQLPCDGSSFESSTRFMSCYDLNNQELVLRQGNGQNLLLCFDQMDRKGVQKAVMELADGVYPFICNNGKGCIIKNGKWTTVTLCLPNHGQRNCGFLEDQENPPSIASNGQNVFRPQLRYQQCQGNPEVQQQTQPAVDADQQEQPNVMPNLFDGVVQTVMPNENLYPVLPEQDELGKQNPREPQPEINPGEQNPFAPADPDPHQWQTVVNLHQQGEQNVVNHPVAVMSAVQAEPKGNSDGQQKNGQMMAMQSGRQPVPAIRRLSLLQNHLCNLVKEPFDLVSRHYEECQNAAVNSVDSRQVNSGAGQNNLLSVRPAPVDTGRLGDDPISLLNLVKAEKKNKALVDDEGSEREVGKRRNSWVESSYATHFDSYDGLFKIWNESWILPVKNFSKTRHSVKGELRSVVV